MPASAAAPEQAARALDTSIVALAKNICVLKMRTTSTALLVLGLGVCHTAAKCLNVDVGAAEGGEKTCFTGDDMGMVCGWDGTAEEAYCTADAGGVKVCARAEKGGKCATGELPPANAYTAEQQKAKAGMQAHQPSSND